MKLSVQHRHHDYCTCQHCYWQRWKRLARAQMLRATAGFLPVFLLIVLLVQSSLAQETITIHNKCGFGGQPFWLHSKDGSGQVEREGKISSERPILQAQALSPSGRFWVHFDTVGVHAPARQDINANGLPDYIDSVLAAFDTAYTVEIDTLGYDAPPHSDTILLGSVRRGVYAVYVLELGRPLGNGMPAQGIYGMTRPERRVGEGGLRGRFTAYTVIDNNYSPHDTTPLGKRWYYETGIRALRATAAHEFHHVIQLGSYGNSYAVCSLHEMTSTWMEHRVCPDVRDYEQFFPLAFGFPSTNASATASTPPVALSDTRCIVGYASMLFAEYLVQTHGEQVLRRFWERVRTGEEPFTALDRTLKAQPAPEPARALDEAWCRFSRWMYCTGARSNAQVPAERFRQAATLPMLNVDGSERFTPPSSSYQAQMEPLARRTVRFLVPRAAFGSGGGSVAGEDTLDVCLARAEAFSTQQQRPVELLLRRASSSEPLLARLDEPLTLLLNGSPVLGAANDNDHISTKEARAVCASVFLNSKPASVVSSVSDAFPNPFSPDDDGTVAFTLPVDVDVTPALACRLVVVNSAWQPVLSVWKSPRRLNNRMVIEWDGIANSGTVVQSGVYVVIVETPSQAIQYKLLVR